MDCGSLDVQGAPVTGYLACVAWKQRGARTIVVLVMLVFCSCCCRCPVSFVFRRRERTQIEVLSLFGRSMTTDSGEQYRLAPCYVLWVVVDLVLIGKVSSVDHLTFTLRDLHLRGAVLASATVSRRCLTASDRYISSDTLLLHLQLLDYLNEDLAAQVDFIPILDILSVILPTLLVISFALPLPPSPLGSDCAAHTHRARGTNTHPYSTRYNGLPRTLQALISQVKVVAAARSGLGAAGGSAPAGSCSSLSSRLPRRSSSFWEQCWAEWYSWRAAAGQITTPDSSLAR